MVLLSALVKLIPPFTIGIEESNMPSLLMGLAGMGKQVEVQRR